MSRGNFSKMFKRILQKGPQQDVEQSKTKKDKTWGFQPVKITLDGTNSKDLGQVIKSLPFLTAHNAALVTIRAENQTKVKAHYDDWGYEVKSTPSAAAKTKYQQQLSSLYETLGGKCLDKLVLQGNPETSPTAPKGVVRLRHLTLCLQNRCLKELTLSNLIILASITEVKEFEQAVAKLMTLRRLEITCCSVGMPVLEVKKHDAWGRILTAFSRSPTLEVLHVTGTNQPVSRENLPFVEEDCNIDWVLGPSYSASWLADGLRQAKSTSVKELSLCYPWTKQNEVALVTYLQRAKRLEKLSLSLQVPLTHEANPPLDGILRTLRTNKAIEQVDLHLSGSAECTKLVETIGQETWYELRRDNNTLKELQISPKLPMFVQVQNDLWLGQRITCDPVGVPNGHSRMRDANAKARGEVLACQRADVLVHVLSHPLMSHDLDGVYEILSSTQPILIHRE